MGRFVRDWLLEVAAARPGDEAVVDPHQRWTYADLESSSRRIAMSLGAAGVGTGSRVAMLVGDGAAAVATVHAVRGLGAVLVPLNRRAASAELVLQVAVAEVAFLVHDMERADLARGALVADPTALPLEIEGLLAGSGRLTDAALREEVDLDAPATVLFTSGTTDRPKGAILTHGAHIASSDAWAAFLDPRPGDRWLACVPFFHVAGLAIITRASRWGVPLEVHPRFDPGAVCGALERGVSLVSLVGPMLDRLLAAGTRCSAPRTLRAILVGGGPVFADQVLRARRRGYPVVPTYGLTETASGVAALPADEVGDHPATAGRALHGVQLRIAADGQPARSGQVGEILVRGPMTFAGYVGLPDVTASALREGWLHTGDFGLLDDDGYLTVIDRRDDLIVSGGENVSPSEVEAVLLAHPAVAQAAVVGRPDARWGSVPVAAVVLRPGGEVTDRMLADHCRDRLAGFKVPVAFHRQASLPHAPSGKLLRSAIRELVGEASA